MAATDCARLVLLVEGATIRRDQLGDKTPNPNPCISSSVFYLRTVNMILKRIRYDEENKTKAHEKGRGNKTINVMACR